MALLVFDSGNLPPRPAVGLFYGTFDAEVRPPAPPPGIEPLSVQELENVALRGPTTEGPLVPPVVPASPPVPSGPFARTGGPDGDLSVVHESFVGQGFRFFIEMAPNPPEVPALPPPAPPFGPDDP